MNSLVVRCQKIMVENIAVLVPYGALLSHIILGAIILSFIFRNSWSRGIENFLGQRAVLLAFIVSVMAVGGSLFYSEIVGFEPCVLCWWQRAFIFPLPVILGIAIWKGEKNVFQYVVPLVTLSAIIAIYQSYVYLGGLSLLPCTAVGGACSKVYVKEFGYITIPLMSLTISLYILLLAWVRKIYDKNSNA